MRQNVMEDLIHNQIPRHKSLITCSDCNHSCQSILRDPSNNQILQSNPTKLCQLVPLIYKLDSRRWQDGEGAIQGLGGEGGIGPGICISIPGQGRRVGAGRKGVSSQFFGGKESVQNHYDYFIFRSAQSHEVRHKDLRKGPKWGFRLWGEGVKLSGVLLNWKNSLLCKYA